MSAISIDRAEFPFVRIRFNTAPNNDEFADYLRAYQQLLDAGRPYGALIVTSADLPMTRSKHARMQAEFMTRNRDAITRRVVGIGFVLPSLVTRGVLKAILKWQPMPCPQRVFQYEADGAEWVRLRIQEAAPGAPSASLPFDSAARRTKLRFAFSEVGAMFRRWLLSRHSPSIRTSAF